MNEERITATALQDEVLRRQVMKTPDDVEEMLRLKACGWGLKRIARELGCSHHGRRQAVQAACASKEARRARRLAVHAGERKGEASEVTAERGAAQSHTAAHRPRGEGARKKVFIQGESEVKTVRRGSARSVFLGFCRKQIGLFPMRYCIANARAEI